MKLGDLERRQAPMAGCHRVRFHYDADDPFGTRPDEKPPRGWDAGFWEAVRERIEQERNGPRGAGPHRLPEPPRGKGEIIRVALVAALMAAATAIALRGAPGAGRALPPDEASRTLVRVDGSRAPDVAVEWARSGGLETGYVVLQTIDPEISYVLIDRRLAAR